MAVITKPIITQGTIWGTESAKVVPPDAKLKQGWTQEMMPAEYENYLQNRQDQALAYLYQTGIPEWDSLTEYIANKSFVQYDGRIYLALVTNTNVPPTDGTTWKDILVFQNFVTKTGDSGAANIPVGTTAQRPTTAVLGQLRYNSTTSRYEYRGASAWIELVDTGAYVANQVVTGLWSFRGNVSGGTGFQFGATNHIIRNTTADNSLEVVHSGGASFGIKPDGTFFAKLPNGNVQKFYTDSSTFPLVASFGFEKKVTGATQQIDPKTASVFEVPLSVPETTINILNAGANTPAARQITLILSQDSVGARLVKWPTNIKWASDRPPVLSFLPNRTDVVTLLSTDNGTTWYGFTSGGFFVSN